MVYKPGQVITFYYHNRARLGKVRYVNEDKTVLCSVGKHQFRTFFISNMKEPELVGRMDRVWLWLRGVRF